MYENLPLAGFTKSYFIHAAHVHIFQLILCTLIRPIGTKHNVHNNECVVVECRVDVCVVPTLYTQHILCNILDITINLHSTSMYLYKHIQHVYWIYRPREPTRILYSHSMLSGPFYQWLSCST